MVGGLETLEEARGCGFAAKRVLRVLLWLAASGSQVTWNSAVALACAFVEVSGLRIRRERIAVGRLVLVPLGVR